MKISLLTPEGSEAKRLASKKLTAAVSLFRSNPSAHNWAVLYRLMFIYQQVQTLARDEPKACLEAVRLNSVVSIADAIARLVDREVTGYEQLAQKIGF